MAGLDATLLFEMRLNFGTEDMRIQLRDSGRGKRAIAPAESGTSEGRHRRVTVTAPWPDYIVERAGGLGWSVHAIL